MNLNPYLDVNPEVAAALAEGKPVVALESTIISHGMPYPQNVETALNAGIALHASYVIDEDCILQEFFGYHSAALRIARHQHCFGEVACQIGRAHV